MIEDGLYWSPPGLVVEVLSPSENRRRQEEKLDDYAGIGVPEVWLVSPEAETVEVHLLKDGKLERTAILADGIARNPLNSPAFRFRSVPLSGMNF